MIIDIPSIILCKETILVFDDDGAMMGLFFGHGIVLLLVFWKLYEIFSLNFLLSFLT